MKYFLLLCLILLSSIALSNSYGHTTVQVEQFEIEVGWGVEPPVVGFRNEIIYEITESPSEGIKSGIINAFKNLKSTVKSGGISKVLDINSEQRPGHYFSKIIPTKTGSILIHLQGDINGVPVDVEVPIEDVESTAILDFPPIETSGPSEIGPIKNALTSLQRDVADIKSKIGNVDTNISDINTESTYNFAIFGLSLGAAGVILAIVAMIKRK